MHRLAAILSLLATIAAAVPPADFVIVGAGTSGITVAATLCRRLPRATITLVERGTRRDPAARLQSASPSTVIQSWLNPALAAIVPSAPNKGLQNRTTPIILARNVGGAAAINSGQLLLPPRGVIPSWRIAGLDDARAELLFKRLRDTLNGTGVRPRRFRPAFSDAWLRAAQTAGFPLLDSPYTRPRNATGVFDERVTFDRAGQRVGPVRAFLRPARAACAGRLRVIRGARAERVLFKRGRVARSVVLVRDGDAATGKKSRRVRVFAKREIVLAAGAIDTAALLQRSGVGPQAVVRAHATRVVKFLPVGAQLRLRALMQAWMSYDGPLATENDPAVLRTARAAREFRARRGGPLAVGTFGPMFRLGDAAYGGISTGLSPELQGAKLLSSYCIVNPDEVSSGSVSIVSADGAVPPAVDARLLERDSYVRRVAACYKRMRAVNRALETLIGGAQILAPGMNASAPRTDREVEAAVRSQAGNSFHYVGTCPVGKVVDSRLRLLGLQRVRVVDSSVMATIPPLAGPMGSMYVVALHAADLIVDDHGDLA